MSQTNKLQVLKENLEATPINQLPQAQPNNSTQNALIKKFTSRKFILSFVGMISGILGMIGFADSEIAIVACAAIEICSLIGFLLMEGKADIASIQTGVEIINRVIQMINDLQEEQESQEELSSAEELSNDSQV